MQRLMLRALMAVPIMLAACTPIEAQRGQIVMDDQIAQLKVGITAKAEVTALLGTPTSVATFDDKTWYYIGEDTKQVGIHPALPTMRRVLVLTFDDSGTLIGEKLLGKAEAEHVDMAAGETKVIGTDRTIVQQLIGNVGRFNSDQDDTKKNSNGPGAPKP